MKKLIFFITASIIFILSCTKDYLEVPIIGKWRIQEIYEGYNNGGDFQWTAVPEQDRTGLEFSNEGDFFETKANGEITCTGTFLAISNNEVEINSNCYTSPILWDISIDGNVMLITHLVREGQIIDKYQREE